MTEECAREIFTPVAVCPRCNRKLTIYERRSTYKQNWLLKYELFRRLVYEGKYCGCELEEQDYIRESVNIKGVGNMDINNLSETEQQDFYRLLKKMEGKEPGKKSCVWKPEEHERYYYIDEYENVCVDNWDNYATDMDRLNIGNVFRTREKAEFALEKRKVEVELQRYAEEHNDPSFSERYYILLDKQKEMLLIECYATSNKPQGAVLFTTEEVSKDAIKAVGEDRILKYIFGVESEETE